MKYGSIESLNCHLPYNEGNDNSNKVRDIGWVYYFQILFFVSIHFKRSCKYVYTLADLGVGWWGWVGNIPPHPVSVKFFFCFKTTKTK